MFDRKYPYTTMNDYNLDWIIIQVKKLLDYFDGIDQFATETYVDDAIENLRNQLMILIDLKLNKTDFDNFVYEVRQSLNSIDGAIDRLDDATSENARNIISVYNSLKQYIDDQIYNIEVINPLTGQQQPIQLVLNYMSDLLRADSLTAEEYDDAELTAQAYDLLELTAYTYDNYGKNYIS